MAGRSDEESQPVRHKSESSDRAPGRPVPELRIHAEEVVDCTPCVDHELGLALLPPIPHASRTDHLLHPSHRRRHRSGSHLLVLHEPNLVKTRCCCECVWTDREESGLLGSRFQTERGFFSSTRWIPSGLLVSNLWRSNGAHEDLLALSTCHATQRGRHPLLAVEQDGVFSESESPSSAAEDGPVSQPWCGQCGDIEDELSLPSSCTDSAFVVLSRCALEERKDAEEGVSEGVQGVCEGVLL